MTIPLPLLDCHAHVAPDVTAQQIRGLDGAHVFAVTRTLDEAAHAAARAPDDAVTWGLGTHPGLAAARKDFDPDRFAELLPRFALVGEIGMDGGAGDLPGQTAILRAVLRACQDAPVLLSIHSNRATKLVAELLTALPHPGAVLHWWLGDNEQTASALAAGAYFSVNAAAKDGILAAVPKDRILPETDFARPGPRGRKPGDTSAVIRRLAAAWNVSPEDANHQCWTNLRRLAVRSGALDRLPETTADVLLNV